MLTPDFRLLTKLHVFKICVCSPICTCLISFLLITFLYLLFLHILYSIFQHALFQNHVAFLFEELLRLPSFPRKALETEFDMYNGEWGKVFLLFLPFGVMQKMPSFGLWLFEAVRTVSAVSPFTSTTTVRQTDTTILNSVESKKLRVARFTSAL